MYQQATRVGAGRRLPLDLPRRAAVLRAAHSLLPLSTTRGAPISAGSVRQGMLAGDWPGRYIAAAEMTKSVSDAATGRPAQRMSLSWPTSIHEQSHPLAPSPRSEIYALSKVQNLAIYLRELFIPCYIWALQPCDRFFLTLCVSLVCKVCISSVY